MASKKQNRRNIAFNLAFLDVMSCGFGAAVLLFLIIKHGVAQNPSNDVEAARLLQDIAAREAEIAQLDVDMAATAEQLGAQAAAASNIEEAIASASAEEEAVKQVTVSLSGKIEEAKKALSAFETQVEKQEKDSKMEIEGQSSQQFLTGLSVKGNRIVIMIDHSASMLDEKILNIVRRRAIGGETASKAPKWLRAKKIAQWLVNRLPKGSQVRFVSFSEKADIFPKDGWVRTSNTKKVYAALQKTINMTPSGGTNLYEAMNSLNSLSPKPDAVYLVTDGLPTKGRKKTKGSTVSGKQRRELFGEAVKAISRLKARTNVVLLPMEGDPDAAFAFWQLTRSTGGRLLIPSEKWP